MKIGKTIRELRKKKGLNQTVFAKMCGITQTSLSQIETDTTASPHLSTLEKISKALGAPLPFIYFLGIEEIDVPEANREKFRLLRPSLTFMLRQICE